MATTVTSAWDEFLKNTVNLDKDETATARASRDWLFDQIAGFPDTFDDFPRIHREYDIAYGSFARRTKLRPLDDIDVISGMHATGATYSAGPDTTGVTITSSAESRLANYCDDGTLTVNSTKILNRYVKALSTVPQYRAAAIGRHGEAAVLNLASYPWSFDVVPGFLTASDALGRSYYLIPDGSGQWKKTDPRKDRDRLDEINRRHDGNIRRVIRAMKYWNRRKTKPGAEPYLFECMVANLYEARVTKATEYVDFEVAPVLEHWALAVWRPVDDPKGIQGDLNQISFADRLAIQARAKLDAERAREANGLEGEGKHEEAIAKWREIFGDKFPAFG